MRRPANFQWVFAVLGCIFLSRLSAMQPCRSTEIKTERLGIAPVSLHAGYPQIFSVRGGAYFDFSESYCSRSAIYFFLEPGITSTKAVIAYGLEGYYIGVHAGLGYLYNYSSLFGNGQRQFWGGEIGIRGFSLQLIAGLYSTGVLSPQSVEWVANVQVGFFIYSGSPQLR